jgi:hypothetical protein
MNQLMGGSYLTTVLRRPCDLYFWGLGLQQILVASIHSINPVSLLQKLFVVTLLIVLTVVIVLRGLHISRFLHITKLSW